MSKKLFVGGLAWATTDATLRAAFETCGEVVDAKVILERETKRSRGFGFVTFKDESVAAAACESMNGQMVDGRAIRVNVADESPRRPSNHRDALRRPSGERAHEVRSEPAEREMREEREYGASNRREASYPSSYADAMPYDNSGSRRDGRRKDKKRRDRFDDDDERW